MDTFFNYFSAGNGGLLYCKSEGKEGSYLGIPEQSHFLQNKDELGAQNSVFSVVWIRGLLGV